RAAHLGDVAAAGVAGEGVGVAAVDQHRSDPGRPEARLGGPGPRGARAGRRGWASWTGAAGARLTVKQPAADAGTSLTTRARSFRAGLMPAWSPAKRNPSTVTETPPGPARARCARGARA